MEDTLQQQIKEYNEVNNTFKKRLLYHVGIDAGFHSEVDAMMECMLYCYVNQIKFILYADDANFTGGMGWNEFFDSFCEESHNSLNKIANYRYSANQNSISYLVFRWILKKMERVQYLSSEVFEKCIPREYSQSISVKWPIFSIDGSIFDEFGKLGKMVLHYNDRTANEVSNLILALNLPETYTSIQFRGGDKKLEFDELMETNDTLKRIDEAGIEIKNLFIFTDDYKYVKEVREKRPQWNVYTLTYPDECGYDNNAFNHLDWKEKRKHMIKLFAMVDICLESNLHLGCEQTCVNNYIKSCKNTQNYFPIY